VCINARILLLMIAGTNAPACHYHGHEGCIEPNCGAIA
jgi:hypothetical protein